MSQITQQPFWESRGLPAPGTRMLPSAYDRLPETNLHMELIDGVVVYPHWDEETGMNAPSLDHQRIVLNIAAWLRHTARQHGGTPYIAPVDVWLSEALRVQPDVVWLAAASQCIREETLLRGAPELVVEVLSPSTAQRDRIDKFDLYEAHGALEYWLLDPRDLLMEVYTRTDAALRRMGAYKPGDSFVSPALGGLSVPVGELFA